MADEREELGERPPIEPRLLTLDEVATYLAVSKAQVYAMVRSGELPGVKLGGRGVWRIDRRRLDDYIDHLHVETQAWTDRHPLGERTEKD
jgi:excisionase family DNA binding protein